MKNMTKIKLPKFPQTHPGRKQTIDGPDKLRPKTIVDVKHPVFQGSYSAELGALVLKSLRRARKLKKRTRLLGGKTPVDTSPCKDGSVDVTQAGSRPTSKAMKTLKQYPDPNTELKVKRLFDELLTRQQAKKKKRFKLPVDLSISGTFPQPNNSLTERMNECRDMLRLLHDWERTDCDHKAQTTIRVVKEHYREQKRIAQLIAEQKKRLVTINDNAVLVDEGIFSTAAGIGVGLVARSFVSGLTGSSRLGNVAGVDAGAAVKGLTNKKKPLRAITKPHLTIVSGHPLKKKNINPATGKEFRTSNAADWGLRFGPADVGRKKRMGML
jgi:hypothetical protein